MITTSKFAEILPYLMWSKLANFYIRPILVCVCVCVCVCERERERECERESEWVSVCVWERERESVCVCVCVCGGSVFETLIFWSPCRRLNFRVKDPHLTLNPIYVNTYWTNTNFNTGWWWCRWIRYFKSAWTAVSKSQWGKSYVHSLLEDCILTMRIAYKH
jgi:hypothetical protein